MRCCQAFMLTHSARFIKTIISGYIQNFASGMGYKLDDINKTVLCLENSACQRINAAKCIIWCVNPGIPFWTLDKTQGTRVITSILFWTTCWRHGHSWGETNYRHFLSSNPIVLTYCKDMPNSPYMPKLITLLRLSWKLRGLLPLWDFALTSHRSWQSRGIKINN